MPKRASLPYEVFLYPRGFSLYPRGFSCPKVLPFPKMFPCPKRFPRVFFLVFPRVFSPYPRVFSFPLLQEFYLPPFPCPKRVSWPFPTTPTEGCGNASRGSFCWIHGIREGLCFYLAGGRGFTTKGIQDPWKSHGPEPGSWLGNASGGSFSWISRIRESGNQGRAAAVPLSGRRPGLHNKRDWVAG